jgi:hypothetical protein
LTFTVPPLRTRLGFTQPDAQATCLITGLPTYAWPPELALVSAAPAGTASGNASRAAAPAALPIHRRLWLDCKSALSSAAYGVS